MTNDEPLLEDLAIRDLMSKKGVRLESTVGFAPEEVLRTLARHRHLDANDSTLTVWAHILAGTQVNFRDSRLSALAAHLGAHGPGR
jgi:predicted kinase